MGYEHFVGIEYANVKTTILLRVYKKKKVGN